MTLMGRFFAWWGGELAALVPGPVVRLLAPARPELLVLPDAADALHLVLVRGRRRRDLGPPAALTERQHRALRRDIARGRMVLVLALPGERTITQRASLPLAAADDLDAVLSFEFDRLTPFRLDEVHAAHRVVARRAEAGRLDVELVFARRADLAPLIAAVEALGLGSPGRLDVPGDDGRPAGLDLMAASRPRRRSVGRIATRALSATAAALALVLAVLALERRAGEAEALRDAVFTARRLALASEDRVTAGGEAAALAAYRAHAATPPAGEIVTLLTDLLPDDTYLERLTVEGARIEAAGLSARATGLVALFEASPDFAEPRYAAPITRSDEDGRQRFLIEARFLPSGTAPLAPAEDRP